MVDRQSRRFDAEPKTPWAPVHVCVWPGGMDGNGAPIRYHVVGVGRLIFLLKKIDMFTFLGNYLKWFQNHEVEGAGFSWRPPPNFCAEARSQLPNGGGVTQLLTMSQ